MLPPISNVAKASKIVAWKKKLAVSNCFQIFLNLKNEVIKMLEEIIQPSLARNLRKIENEEDFEYESDSFSTPQRPVSLERQKDPEKQIEPERNKRKKRSIEIETLRKNLKKSKRKMLPPISNVAKASKIVAWKKKLAVSNCFQIFLNLKNEVIKMLEEIIQPSLARNLRKIENEEDFEYESDSFSTPQRPVSLERQKDPEKQIEPERNKRKKRSEEGEEGDEGKEGEDDDDEDEKGKGEESEDEKYHNEIVNIESED
ncbi:hypothetical protein Glove_627g55 [Diversispora epigaea]|uniref:Uncharacterized protein n=1 Tax=Diversispora epigaea TaxID=1348612 RepID=A0A397GA74_9GLOM|nr:hypothetical protein Glove_627g55 [Diversispora epigaea]